jgi:hypothetical protein
MIYNKYDKHPKPMQITDEEQAAFDNARHCHICDKLLISREKSENDNDYARFETAGRNPITDHCHISDKYRGATHCVCNLQNQVPDFHPIVIHNLSGFDGHSFIKEFKGIIKCIPTTDEKYISFTREVVVDHTKDETGKKKAVMRNLRFIDSYKFMPASLDSSLKNLRLFPISANSLKENNFNNS